MTLIRVAPPLQQDVDLTRTYDAVVVGSGPKYARFDAK